jgi:carbon storage regulator CsrA
MLILQRRLGESVVVDGKTTVTFLRIDGDKIKLGFEAPDAVRIDRLEIHNERLAGFPKKEAVA